MSKPRFVNLHCRRWSLKSSQRRRYHTELQSVLATPTASNYRKAILNSDNDHLESGQFELAIPVLERLVQLQPGWEQPRANLEALRNRLMPRER
jgi:hypothetical protein